jgi:hypothetical protein
MNPGVGSLYGVVTFAILAGGFVALTSWLWGWQFPSGDRMHTSVQLTVFLVAGFFSMKVGKHRDVPYLRAVGRAVRDLVMR